MTDAVKPAEYHRRAHELRTATVAPRLAVLSSFTADPLAPYLAVETDRLGVGVRPWIGPVGVFEQLVLATDSPLWQPAPSAMWLALRIEDTDPNLVCEFPAIGADKASARLRRIVDRLANLVVAIRSRSDAHVLVSNFHCPPALDIFDSSDPDGLVHLVSAANRSLAQALAKVPGAHTFDWAAAIAECGATAHDPQLWSLARTPLATAALLVIAKRLARCLRACNRPAAKCLVVDLDNTLWGGELGDVGIGGLQLGDDYPGNAFKAVQRALRELRNRGFLLAIASKNDEPIVRDALARHPDMLLRESDFAVIAASWEPKDHSLRRIAEQLNIGLDALVFLDDNPIERAHIRAALPMVRTVDLPAAPEEWPAAIAEIAALDRPRTTTDDHARPAMVAQDTARRELIQAGQSIDEFLCGLEMVARVGDCDSLSLDRIHQLIHKTNQFNLTCRRHTAAEVMRLSESRDAAVRWLRLRDRFGDLGLVGVGILRKITDTLWEVDTLLISCRVAERGVEDAILSDLAAICVRGGGQRIRGHFQASARNHVMRGFYLKRGFVETHRDNTIATYEFDLSQPLPPWPRLIGLESTPC